ncbi:MFS transporter [Streptomyces sp. FH025]|uniref:MFS transporter n=1 Tax=Streptomyces sp. FH025 TaxID=2815937 RepID=UPI001A9E68FF|nr:MFS transporter [Streptomyces sp. FH025]MBO1414579.1 MFS transporter [Streptomyces sp. FH025]
MRGNGLWAQLRRPPGGRDARIMLLAQGVDRTGTGVWAAASVLYFTYVCGMDARQLGLLLGVGAVAGIAGSPLAGRAAERLSLRGLLTGCHLLRLGAMGLLLVADHFAVLLATVALICLAERGAKTLEMLFATRVAGERRGTYQALFRSVANAGYAVGAGVSAIGLAVGTTTAYRALIAANALSYLLAAVLIRRTEEPAGRGLVAAEPSEGPLEEPTAVPSPWRDRGYLLFVLLDLPMCLDDSILNVGLPLWLIHHTDAPHAVVPVFLTLNTVLVVLLQLKVSAWAERPGGATTAVGWYGVILLTACLLIALSTDGGPWTASIALLAAAALVTLAELMRSVSSWELAVSLAPPRARASYLGVAGMSQSVQRSVGPLLLTGAVMAAG